MNIPVREAVSSRCGALRRLMAVLCLVMTVTSLSAKGKEAPDTISARRAFVEMPALVLDLLPVDTRLDMLAYFDADSIWDATNEFEGKSRLVNVTPDYLKVDITPVTSMQIKVLHAPKGDVVLTIYTTGGDGESKDSDIRFYDASMKELDASKYFKVPLLKDFFNIPKGSATKMSEIEDLMPFYTIDFNASPDNDTLTGTLTPGDFLTVEDMKIVSLFMQPTVTYTWDGKKFK